VQKQSCRKDSTGEACRYYRKQTINSKPLCPFHKTILTASMIKTGCDDWMQPPADEELKLEEILNDVKMTNKQKFEKLYPTSKFSEFKSGSLVFEMNDGAETKFIFGTPQDHEIVNKFKVDDEAWSLRHTERIPEASWYVDHDNLMLEVAYAYNNNLSMSLVGHSGTGKSMMIKQFAAIIKAPIYRVNFHGMTTTDDIIGKLLPTGEGRVDFVDGGVTECVRHGGILIMEELNACSQEVLFALHGLFDDFGSLVLVEKDNEIVSKHPMCKIFSTMNPSEYTYLYPGTKDLSTAFASRIPIFRQVDFLDNKSEAKLLNDLYPSIAKKTVKEMVNVAVLARNFMREGKLNYVFSTRVLKNWASLTIRFGILRAAEIGFLGHMDSNARAIVISEILDVASTLDCKLLKSKYIGP
jgi:MoxR-like ATPase